MKYNLKNRPKSWAEDETQSDDYYIYKDSVVEWFEGFEKELRKNLQAFIDEYAWPECSEFSVKETIKEILGENDQT